MDPSTAPQATVPGSDAVTTPVPPVAVPTSVVVPPSVATTSVPPTAVEPNITVGSTPPSNSNTSNQTADTTQPQLSLEPIMTAPSSPPSVPEVMAAPVMQAASSIPAQPVPMGSAKSKEAGSISNEIVPTIEIVGSDAIEKEPLPPEVASWMEKVNRDTSGEKPPEIVVADTTANGPTGAYASHPVFVLPLGDATYQKALHSSVNDSIRWLAEWCKKVIKKMGNQAAFNN